MKTLRYIICAMCLLFARTASLSAMPSGNFDSTFTVIKAIKDDSVRMIALFKFQTPLRDADPSRALVVAQEMEAAAAKLHNDEFTVTAYSVVGWAYLRLKNNSKALEYFIRHLKKSEEMNDPELMAKSYLAMATIYKEGTPEELKTAESYLKKSLTISRQNEKVNFYSLNVYSELGQVYQTMKDYQKAIATYREGLQEADEQHNARKKAVLLINLGQVLKTTKDYSTAMEVSKQAEHIADSLGFDYGKNFAGSCIADLHFLQGNVAESERKAKEVLDLAQQLQQQEVQLGMYELLKNVYTKQKQYPQALDYFAKWTTLKDTISNREQSAKIAELKTQYETELKDGQIETQNAALAFNKKRNSYYLAAMGLLALTGGGIFFSYRRTAKLNKRITGQQEQLIVQKKELEQVNAVKDRLFSVISHDLRTPVNSLLSFMLLLRNQQVSPEKLAAYTTTLSKNLSSTAELLENLLHFSKTQIAATKPVLEQVNIYAVANDALHLMADALAQKNITVENRMPKDQLVIADINMISLIFRNLLSNAVKYTYSDTVITLSAALLGDKVLCKIEDQGVGMPAEMVTAFNKGIHDTLVHSTPGTADEKGTGLGLMLCSTFIAQMNGQLTLTSQEGKGSRFTIVLPAA